MPDKPYTLDQLINFLRRELELRRDMNQKRVRDGYVTKETADYEEGAYAATIDNLVKQKTGVKLDPDVKGSLHQQCMAEYFSFYKRHVGIPPKISAADGKGLKEIIKYLSSLDKVNTESEVLTAWKFVLDNWEHTGPFIGKQKKLTQINTNLAEILDKIRNGHDKKAGEKTRLTQLELSLKQRRQGRTG